MLERVCMYIYIYRERERAHEIQLYIYSYISLGYVQVNPIVNPYVCVLAKPANPLDGETIRPSIRAGIQSNCFMSWLSADTVMVGNIILIRV